MANWFRMNIIMFSRNCQSTHLISSIWLSINAARITKIKISAIRSTMKIHLFCVWTCSICYFIVYLSNNTIINGIEINESIYHLNWSTPNRKTMISTSAWKDQNVIDYHSYSYITEREKKRLAYNIIFYVSKNRCFFKIFAKLNLHVS